MTTTKNANIARLTIARQVIVGSLTALAFYHSYGNTVDWFANHGQAEHAPLLAAIPEVAIIMVLITLALGGMDVITTYIIGAIGVGSVAITITANLEGADSDLAGAIAALVAPGFAVLGAALELVSLIKTSKARKRTTTVTKPVATAKPVTAAAPVAKKRNRGVIDRGILWASEQPTWPSVDDLVVEFPTINRNTASRIHNSRAAKASV
jgi:hypothetical protein